MKLLTQAQQSAQRVRAHLANRSLRAPAQTLRQGWQQRLADIREKARSWRQAVFSQGGDPSAHLFQGIQRKLILWYGGVLAAILIIAGVVLYVTMQHELLRPANDYLVKTSQFVGADWQRDQSPPCLRFPPDAVPYMACYDATGTLIAAHGFGSQVPGFLGDSLALSALAHGAAQDTVDGGNSLGAISRYAYVVHDANDGDVEGVVLVGYPIEQTLHALSTLLRLLLLVGILTLVGASVGGLILAQRALAPAHLAYTRQQAFIGDASHELRTPLTILRAEAEVLLQQRDRMTPEDADLLDDIVNEVDHLTSITGNLLTLARLDGGRAEMKRDVIDLADVAAQTVHRATALAQEKQVSLNVEHADRPILALGDQRLLDQAMLILVDNAIKYNVPNGSVTVRAWQRGNEAIVEVRDTGIGIAAEHLAHLGERFFRPDPARARATGGNGLGLSIAFAIARAHHGSLKLTSTLGKGTTALLALPAPSVPEA